jgi:uncharacterized protein DUF547
LNIEGKFMNRISIRKLTISFTAILFIFAIGFVSSSKAETEEEGFSYSKYSVVLKTYVDNRGMVNYSALKSNKSHLKDLNDFIVSVGSVKPGTYNGWSSRGKVAFLINAYNVFVIKVVLDNYPIKSTLLLSTLYPKNSIRQIKGVFSEVKFKLMGKVVTLDDIEHKNLRVNFNEPRIHMTLVCAAKGCPKLSNEVYIGEHLNNQLKEQGRVFCLDPRKFRIDKENNVVYLSEIFKWFGEDFILKYEKKDELQKFNESDRRYLSLGEYKIKYIKYDWSLNEKK